MSTTPEFTKLIKATKAKAKKEQRKNKKFFNRIKKKKPAGLTKAFRETNDEVFKKIDCLDCSNCCKTSLAVFENPDVVRISKHFGMPKKDFIKKYLTPHPDYDYLIKILPCPFLASDNKCSIYAIRPAGCRTYPPFRLQLSDEQLDVIYDNLGICPAANEIVERVMTKFADA
ncbi:MAG: YkgJ family cysteine cluster protein [Chitinophagales bacterium]|nr:YkgJ family cysteine cluster protein [Chitinophagales bacterium]